MEDGRIAARIRGDELAARPDLANEARADLFLSIHNNTAVNTSVGGPSTLYFDERPFGGRNARLATVIQEEMLAAYEAASSLDGLGPDDFPQVPLVLPE